MIDDLTRTGGVARAADGSAGHDVHYYLEAAPLFDEQWTGIPAVAAGLAKAMLTRFPANTSFVLDGSVLHRPLVEAALESRSGMFLARALTLGRAIAGPVEVGSKSFVTVGLFPSIKRVRGLFDVECNIIHDISTLLTPQYHGVDNIDYHMEAIIGDLTTNAVTACVSQASADDLTAYFGIPTTRIVVAHNGCSWPQAYIDGAEGETGGAGIEPYFLVLGTVEPRKNLGLIWRMLEQSPAILETHRFVIMGRSGFFGTGDPMPECLAAEVRAGRIIMTGYVSEFEKCKLLMGAEATIYPSWFEGFGLPVVESLSVGTPCIASFSSSLPEAGGECCIYVDPFSVADLTRAVQWIQSDRPKQRPAFRAKCAAHAATFTWDNMLDRILAALAPAIAACRADGHNPKTAKQRI
jgi:glycosyltransferase involved in cell wall biosynthesis